MQKIPGTWHTVPTDCQSNKVWCHNNNNNNKAPIYSAGRNLYEPWSLQTACGFISPSPSHGSRTVGVPFHASRTGPTPPTQYVCVYVVQMIQVGRLCTLPCVYVVRTMLPAEWTAAWRHKFSALGVFHVMRYMNLRYLLTYLHIRPVLTRPRKKKSYHCRIKP